MIHKNQLQALLPAVTANLSLRAISILAKFALLAYLGRYTTLADLGTYGLLVTSLGLGVQLLGMEFYIFNTREILRCDEPERVILFRDQLVFHSLTYIVFLPVLSILFFTNTLPWELITWFYILVVLEHLSQELSRLLTVLGRPVFANFIEFIRSGSWVAIVVTIGLQVPEYRSIKTIVTFWVLGGLLSLFIGWKPLQKWDWSATWKIRPRLDWMRKGVSVAIPFFMSSVALYTIYFSDRFFLQQFLGLEQVGLYTFHQSVAGLVYTAITTGVIGIIYPKLVRSFLVGDMPQYTQELKTFAMAITSATIVVSVFLILVFPFAADFMKDPQFLETRSTFLVLLLASIIQNLSFIPHYDLYARSFDRDLMWATILGAVVNIGLNVLLIPKFGILGAAWATATAFLTLLVAKTVFARIRFNETARAVDYGGQN